MLIFARPANSSGFDPARGMPTRFSLTAGLSAVAGIADVMSRQLSTHGTNNAFRRGMIRRRPVAARVPVADDVTLARAAEQQVLIERTPSRSSRPRC